MGVYVSLAFAAAGALIFDRLRFPAGTMVGSLFGTLLAVFTGVGLLPMGAGAIEAVSVVVGIILALRIDRRVALRLRKLILPAFLVSVAMVGAGFGLSLVLLRISEWHPATASFSAYPGGLEQMILFAGTLGGDVYTVTVVQLFRWLTVVFLYPIAFRFGQMSGRVSKRTPVPEEELSQGLLDAPVPNLASVLVGILGGLIAAWMSIPAGSLVGSFMATAIYRGIFSERGVALNPVLSKLLFAVIGYVVGAGVTRSSFADASGIIPIAAGVTVAVIAAGLLVAFVLQRLTGWNYGLCALALAPAGTLEMTILAEQLDYDPMVVFSLHFTRTVSVIVAAPFLYNLIERS